MEAYVLSLVELVKRSEETQEEYLKDALGQVIRTFQDMVQTAAEGMIETVREYEKVSVQAKRWEERNLLCPDIAYTWYNYVTVTS
jgi:hypothetical protein